MNVLWWFFPLALSVASPTSTFVSHRLGDNWKALMAWQVFYSLFLAAVWGLLFYTQKGEVQARTVAFSLVVPMVMDTVLIHALNDSVHPLKIAGIILVTAGLAAILWPLPGN